MAYYLIYYLIRYFCVCIPNPKTYMNRIVMNQWSRFINTYNIIISSCDLSSITWTINWTYPNIIMNGTWDDLYSLKCWSKYNNIATSSIRLLKQIYMKIKLLECIIFTYCKWNTFNWSHTKTFITKVTSTAYNLMKIHFYFINYRVKNIIFVSSTNDLPQLWQRTNQFDPKRSDNWRLSKVRW